jgi:hypothetical protein
MSGFPLEDSQFRKGLKELLDKYETALAQKPKKKTDHNGRRLWDDHVSNCKNRRN